MSHSTLGLSLLGGMASMAWWIISMTALNNYAASQGIPPRLAFLLFGMIWKDAKNSAFLHLIGLFASTISFLVCLGIGMASGHD